MHFVARNLCSGATVGTVLAVVIGLLNATSLAESLCKEGTVELWREKVGVDTVVYCGTAKCKQRIDEIKARIERLETLIYQDRQAILRWQGQLKGYLTDFDDWLSLSREAQYETYDRALDLLTTLFLTDLDIRAGDRVGLTRQEVEELWHRAEKSVLNKPEFRRLIKEHGTSVEELRRQEGIQGFVQYLKHAYTTADSLGEGVEGYQEGDKEHYARAIISLAGLALKDPRAELLVSTADFTIAAIYANFATATALSAIEDLLELGDQRLETLQNYSVQLRKHVDEKNALRTERQEILDKRHSCSQIPTANCTTRGNRVYPVPQHTTLPS